QFAVGLLLGAAWSPCVGPTLGAASLMAARGGHLGGVALTMLAFGIGAAAPLMLLGLVSREALRRWRGGLAAAGRAAKAALGAVMVVLGLLVLTGL
ncbi:cytochrome c biogenesis protein CcdA, partial [Methylobacterium sp. D54C]